MIHIVSGYYTIPSKQSQEFYYEHMERFFRFLQVPILFFTDAQNYQSLKEMAGPNVRFQLVEFEDLPIFKQFPIDFWKSQITIDPEKYHTWQLGALWACKSYFVQEAAKLLDSDWLMWVDAGCVRTDAWKPILANFGKRVIPSNPGIFLQGLNLLVQKEFFQFPDIYIAGSHILFHHSLVDKFVEAYGKTLERYVEKGMPVIMDQYILASIVQSSEFVHVVLKGPLILDEWFFFFTVF
jgi:hypothetical protein